MASLRDVEQDTRIVDWSSSVHPNNSDDAYDFSGNNGNIDNDNRNNTDSVRCVAR
jgi:hypothetical protein